MSDLRKIMRQAYPDFPGDSIDYIIYQTRVDESNKWREENKKLQARVAELVGTLRFTRDRLLHHGHSTGEIDLVLSKENNDE
jgi:hypothetical protein